MARLIDANSILDDFLKRYTGMERSGKLVFAACEIKQDFADMISDATTVDAVPVRHGHWIMNEDDELYCSVCGYIASLDSDEYFYRGKIRFDDSFYCPNCGAKMDEVSE